MLRLVVAWWPGVAEAWARRVAPATSRVVGALPGWLPFSVAELVVYAAIVAAPLALGLAYRGARRTGLTRARAVAGAALSALAVLGLVVLSFDLAWGLHYARRPLAERLGLRAAAEDGADGRQQLIDLARALIAATNVAYRELHDTDDLGRGTPPAPLGELAPALHAGFETAGLRGVLPQEGQGPARVKPFATSVVLSHLGLSGFFFPWTGEPNVNAMVPGSHLPHVAAHEIAHRRGFAREDEAQFAGFLACVSAPSKAARYSGLLYAQRELLGQMHQEPALVQQLLTLRVPGVQRDVNEMRAFWERYEGPPSRAADAVNHAYLTAQRVPGGISSYRMGVRLLMLCARDGRPGCAPPSFGGP